MISFLAEFVLRCHKSDITPDEKHIEAFLRSVDKLKYKKIFILLCFYYWDELIE